MPRDEEYSDKVVRCEDAGICFWCGEPILQGQARYSVNHSHWGCNEKATRVDFDGLKNSLDKAKRLIRKLA